MIVLLWVAVGGIGAITFFQALSLREQRRQLQELRAKLQAGIKAANLDLQEKCAKQAHFAFKLRDFQREHAAGFTNHYNEKLNKCFVEIQHLDDKLSPGTLYIFKTASDAFEDRVFGQYSWRSEKGKKRSEVPPFLCQVTLPSGETKTCGSLDEFDALIKSYYME